MSLRRRGYEAAALELRGDTYPRRGGDTVIFAWPKGIPISDPEAAIASVEIAYTPLDGWGIEGWDTDTERATPVVFAYQERLENT